VATAFERALAWPPGNKAVKEKLDAARLAVYDSVYDVMESGLHIFEFPNSSWLYSDEISGRIAHYTVVYGHSLYIIIPTYPFKCYFYDFYISFNMLLIFNSYILPLNIPFV